MFPCSSMGTRKLSSQSKQGFIMRLFIILSLFMLTGCVSQPIHLYTGKKVETKELARLIAQDNEVKLITIDGKNIEKIANGWFYLKPGRHRAVVRLNWTMTISAGPVMVPMHIGSSQDRRICLNMEKGDDFYIRAPQPKEDWHPVVKKNGNIIDHSCR